MSRPLFVRFQSKGEVPTDGEVTKRLLERKGRLFPEMSTLFEKSTLKFLSADVDDADECDEDLEPPRRFARQTLTLNLLTLRTF